MKRKKELFFYVHIKIVCKVLKNQKRDLFNGIKTHKQVEHSQTSTATGSFELGFYNNKVWYSFSCKRKVNASSATALFQFPSKTKSHKQVESRKLLFFCCVYVNYIYSDNTVKRKSTTLERNKNLNDIKILPNRTIYNCFNQNLMYK